MPESAGRPKGKRADTAHDRDPRERLLKSDLSFEDLTRKLLTKKPPVGGWSGEKTDGKAEE